MHLVLFVHLNWYELQVLTVEKMRKSLKTEEPNQKVCKKVSRQFIEVECYTSSGEWETTKQAY